MASLAAAGFASSCSAPIPAISAFAEACNQLPELSRPSAFCAMHPAHFVILCAVPCSNPSSRMNPPHNSLPCRVSIQGTAVGTWTAGNLGFIHAPACDLHEAADTAKCHGGGSEPGHGAIAEAASASEDAGRASALSSPATPAPPPEPAPQRM